MASRAWTAYRTALTQRPYLTSGVTSALVLAAGDVLAQGLEHRQYLQSHPAATTSDTPALRFQGNRTLILSVWGGAFFSPFFTRVFQWLETIPAIKQPTPRNLVLRALTIFAVSQPLNVFFFVYTNTAEYFLPVDRLGEKHILASNAAAPLSPPLAAGDRQRVAVSAVSASSSSPALTAYETISGRATAQIVEKTPTVVRNALLVWGTFNYFVCDKSSRTVVTGLRSGSRALSTDCCYAVLLAMLALLCWQNQGYVPLQYRVVTGSFVSILWNCWMSMTAHDEVKSSEQQSVVQEKLPQQQQPAVLVASPSSS